MLITYGDHHKRERGERDFHVSAVVTNNDKGEKRKKREKKKINRSPIIIFINFNFSGDQIMINY